MRLALLLLACVPIWAQVRATFEPLADAETKRTTGVKDLTLWNVTVESNQASVNRGDVERLTAFTELRPSMAEDMIRKSSGADGRTLAGKGWDGIAPLGGPMLLSWGISATNYWSIGIGGVVTVGNVVRGLLKGQAPEGTMYLPEFMPDVMACKGGYCGNWLVLTSKIGKPEKVEVGSFSAEVLSSRNPQPPAMSGETGDLLFRCKPINGGACSDGSYVTSPAEAVPSWPSDCGCIEGEPCGCSEFIGVTHPQIPDEDEARALQVASWVRERSAMGVSQ